MRLVLFHAQLRHRALDQLSVLGQNYLSCCVSFTSALKPQHLRHTARERRIAAQRIGGSLTCSMRHATADDALVKLLTTRLPFVPINHNNRMIVRGTGSSLHLLSGLAPSPGGVAKQGCNDIIKVETVWRRSSDHYSDKPSTIPQ